MRRFLLIVLAGYALLPLAALPFLGGGTGKVRLLNVSYDPTRALWADLNREFRKREPGVDIRMSHGGSGSQARAVNDGLAADVVTLALWSDIDGIRARGLIPAGWEQRLPNDSLPYTSTIVFVVRKGNPLGVRDWPDLLEKAHPNTGKPAQLITPNPKTSGNGKLVFLAAWGAALERGDDPLDFATRMYQRQRTPILPASARQATVTFAYNKIGDVHLTWENEAYLEVEESGGTLEIVYPPISLRAEPPVAWLDRSEHADLAERYLRFLYEPEAQEVIARHHYRPNAIPDTTPDDQAGRWEAARQAERAAFPPQARAPHFRMFAVTERIDPEKGWKGVEARFFKGGAVFDQIITGKR